MTPAQSLSDVVGDTTGTYRATILRGPADAARLHGRHIPGDDMYFRGGVDRSGWIQLSGSVLIEHLGEGDKPVGQDLLLASEFNARFGASLPVQ